MSDSFDSDSAAWEKRWQGALESHGNAVAQKPSNAYLVEVAEPLAAGTALDAGCGHGAETLWLASRGWRVTAVDFATTALDFGRGLAEALGGGTADRVDWVQADLGPWTPPTTYDLVVCIYVHIAGDVAEFVQRMANAVAPGGSLLMVGHQNIDQVQVSVTDAVKALDLRGWEFPIAEERDRAAGGVDAVVHARRI